MNADYAAAFAYPTFESVFFGCVEKDAGVVVENDNVDVAKSLFRKQIAVAGLAEIPTVFVRQFREDDFSLRSRFRVIEPWGGRRMLAELVDSVDSEVG